MALQWVSINLQTGSVLGEFPELRMDQDLTQTMSQYDSGSVTIPIIGPPYPPNDWYELLAPWATALIALDEGNRPVYGGIVQQLPRQGSASSISVPIATAESYLTRRDVREPKLQYPGSILGVCQAAQNLLGRYVIDGAPQGTGQPGIPLRVVLLDRGVSRDITLRDTDDKTIYSVFQDLGFEYTITWEWSDPTHITPVITMGTRIGLPAPAGLMPNASFDYPGNVLDVSIVEDWTDGKGANDVMATSSGIGSVRPQSAHQIAANFLGRPTLEYRYSAGASIQKLAQLNTDAQSTLADLSNGSIAVTLSGKYGFTPAYGVDWGIGDDVSYSAAGPMFPDNPKGVVRAIGVSFGTDTFSPILAGS